MRRFRPFAALALLLLAGCATVSADADPYAPNDPLEDVNRAIFAFNLGFDDYVLVPTAKAYLEGGYEPTVALAGPESEDILLKAMRKLLKAEGKGGDK